MNKYNVLWVDDEFDSRDLQEIADKAEDKFSIVLNGIKSAEEAVEELDKINRNEIHYDAILLDARFYQSKNDINNVDGIGLRAVTKKLDQLEGKGIVLPRFILTGQKDLEKNLMFEETYGKSYSKHSPEDINVLLSEIWNQADKRIDTQIRHNNKEVFSIFELGYLPVEIEVQVLELFKAKRLENRAQIKSILANIRSIHESCLLQLESINVIPDSQVSFNSIVKHLSGNKTSANGYQSTTAEYQNDAIENLNKWIYFTCGKYIHNLKDENYCGYMISNYAVESLKTGILEILLWFKKIYEENK